MKYIVQLLCGYDTVSYENVSAKQAGTLLELCPNCRYYDNNAGKWLPVTIRVFNVPDPGTPDTSTKTLGIGG